MSRTSSLCRWISSILDPLRPASSRNRQTALHRRSLNIEPLEQRALLSVSLPQDPMDFTDTSAVVQTLASAPMAFVENMGQSSDASVRYLFQGVGANVLCSDSGLIYQAFPGTSDVQAVVFRGAVVGGREVQPVGVEELPGRVNYLMGDDSDQWHTDLATYGGVAYAGILDGVDLYFSGSSRSMKYEFHVAPGTTAADQIAVRFEGIEGLAIDESGALHISTAAGELVDASPYIYQEIGGERVTVEGSYRLIDEFTYGFDISGDYDPTAPLVIDPDLTWSTFLGGNSSDYIQDIAIDGSGNVYATGYTYSSDFPTTPGVYDTSFNGSQDVFITKLNANGSSPAYSTYLGGSDNDMAYGIAVDANGNVYVTGDTRSYNLPTTSGAYRTYSSGGNDVFVTKLNAAGNALVYSTYLGGSANDFGRSIAVDAYYGGAYVTGFTYSSNFPTTAYCHDPSMNDPGYGDAFVTRINNTGGGLWYSTFLGGSNSDYAYDIVVCNDLSAIVVGATQSTDFPTTAGAYDTTHNGYYDIFVTQLMPAGGYGLSYSTFIGGYHADYVASIALESYGNVVIAGNTQSTDFPVTPGAAQTTLGGGRDAYVMKFSITTSSMTYCTFLGGNADDYANGVAVDAYGRAYIAGDTNSPNFPLAGNPPYDYTFSNGEAFITLLSADGSQRQYSTFLGGSSSDSGRSVAVDANGNVYVGGYTGSSDFPTTPGAYDTSYSNGGDGYISKFNFLSAAPTSLMLLPGNDTGVSHSDGITSNNNSTGSRVLAFLVNGTTPGATVTVYYNGTAIASATASGTATYVVCNTSTVLPDGTYSFTARQTIPYRPESVDSPAINITIDTTASSVPAAPDLNTASDSGRYWNDNVTNDTTPTLDLSGYEGYYRLFREDVQISGDYESAGQFTEAAPLADGVYNYALQAVDAAGNLSEISTALAVTIDTVAVAGSWDQFYGTTSAYYGGISETPGSSQRPAAAIDPTGRTVVAWQTSIDAGNSEIYVRRWTGSAWEELAGSATGGGISANAGLSQQPAILIGADGNPIVAWQDNSSGHYEIYVRRWNGSAWVELAGSAAGGGVSNNGGSSTVPTLTLDSDGNPIVAWQETFYVYAKKWNGTAWVELGGSATGGGISGGGGWARNPVLTTDAGGSPVVAWWNDDFSGNTEIHVRRWDGSAWVELAGSASGSGISNNSGASYHPAIAADPAGGIVVVWYDTTSGNNEIYARRWDGSAWVELGGSATAGGISNNPASSTYPSVTIDSDGNPIVAWSDDWSGNNEIYIRRWNGSQWVEMADGSAIRGGVSNNSGLSVEPVIAGASPVIVWTDTSSGQAQIYARQYTPPSISLYTETGVSFADGITNENMPIIDLQGYGEYSRLFRNGEQLGGDYVNYGGRYWQYPPLDDGDYVFTLVIPDRAGNVASETYELHITIDTVPPPAPGLFHLMAESDTGAFNYDRVTNDNTPTFQVMAESYYRVYRNDVQISGDYETAPFYTTDVQPDGTWTFSVRSVDAAGNVNDTVVAQQVTIDTAAPARPSQPDLDAASDTGVYDTDNLTNDATPTFNLSGYGAYYRFYRDGVQISDDYATAAQFNTIVPLGQGNYTYALRAVDVAGNVSTESVYLYVGIDLTPPAVPMAPDLDASSDSGYLHYDNITNDATPQLNLSGYGAYYRLYRNGSQISANYATTAPYIEPTILPDGVYTYLMVALDQAGNMSGPSAALTVTIDAAAPEVQAVLTPSPNANGWNNSDVQISFNATDALSGVLLIDPPVILGEGANQSATGTATDRAGNVGSVTVNNINIDKTSPSTTATLDGMAGNNGWYVGDVTVTLSADDNLSGIAATYYALDGGPQEIYVGPFTVAGDSIHSLSYWSEDAAGNVEDANNAEIKIDTTPPEVTLTPDRLDDSNGWYNHAIDFTVGATDDLSGVATQTADFTYSGPDSNSASVTATATDEAGNTATATYDFQYDATKPTLDATLDPLPNAAGWNNTAVTVSFAAQDDMSGIDFLTDPIVLSDEGAGQEATGTARDAAGNETTLTVNHINIDLTNPTTTANITGAAGNNGWYVGDVTVTLSADDNLSGVAATYYALDGGPQQIYVAPFVVSSDLIHSLSYWSEDAAGNVEDANNAEIKIDTTPPEVTLTPDRLDDSNGWYNHAIDFTVGATDDLSGVATQTADFAYSGPDSNSASVTATATDEAGNTATATYDFQYDATKPTVTVEKAAGQLDATDQSPIHFTVTFSEPVADFDAGDVTLGGTAPGALTAVVTGGGLVYDIAVSGMTGSGTIEASIAAGAAHDTAGNANLASTSADNTVLYSAFSISNVVVIEAQTPRDGTFKPNEQIVITWAINGENPVATRSLKVDGQAVTTLYGPYASGTPGTTHWSGLFGPLASGSHQYTIEATDTKGNTAVYTGSFEVESTGLEISSVVVAEAQSPRNGILESSEQLVITWAVTGANPVAEKLLIVDGKAVTKLYGPYASGTPGTTHWSGLFGPLTAGTHQYSIYVADTSGLVAVYDGAFEVKGPGPVISSVVVAEAQTPKNGVLESNEQLVITWAAASANPIASKSLTIDGRPATAIYGPYASGIPNTSYYAGVFGPVTAGSHQYTIRMTDTKGAATTYNGTFNVAAAVPALTLDVAPARQAQSPSLTDAQLANIVLEAERRLAAATGIQTDAVLGNVRFQIADLPGNRLGEAVDAVIRIDRDAAGYGWFLDPTPDDDLEFANVLRPSSLSASSGSLADGRVDLLTAVMHEMGHLLGYEHSDASDLMAPTLSLGNRRTL